jgi:hypothetical protein
MNVHGIYIPMSHIASGNTIADVYNAEDFLFMHAKDGHAAEVEWLLKAGADVTQRGINGKPVLIIARESLAETNPTLKPFTDEISRMIIEAKEAPTRRRRHHALAAFGRTRRTRRTRRV